MASGGARARSGPAANPMSARSTRTNREFRVLALNPSVEVPKYPLPRPARSALDYWAYLWSKPQAVFWLELGLEYQVAAYVKAYLDSTKANASSGLKTTVLRMEDTLAISAAGLRSNGLEIGTPTPPTDSKRTKQATNNVAWLSQVQVVKEA